MTTTETVVRLCEYLECDSPLVKRRGETNARFAARRFHSLACMVTATQKNPDKPAPAKRPNPGLNNSPPPFVPRIENGVWRPNAAGWPAQPRIPGAAR